MFNQSIQSKFCSELVAEVLSVLNKLKINNIPKNSKTYIYVEQREFTFGRRFSEIYDFTTEEWNCITFEYGTLPATAEIFMYKDKLYQLSNKSGNGKAAMYVLSFKDKVWIDTETSIPFDTRGFGTAVLDDCLYACGGASKITHNEEVEKNDVWRFSIETCTWQAITSMKQSRVVPRIVALQRFIYAIGGHRLLSSLSDPTIRTVERYDPLTDVWTIVSYLGVEASYYRGFGAVALNDKIYLCGGTINHNPSALLQAYDLKTNKWTKLASMNTARCNHLVVKYNGKIWAIGGQDANFAGLSSVEVYDPVNDSWTYGKPMSSRISGFVTGCVFSSSSCEL